METDQLITIPMMGPIESIKTCCQKFFTHKGRARRSEFWWFWLFCNVLSIVPYMIYFNAMEDMSQYYYYAPDSVNTRMYFSCLLLLLINVPLIFARIRRFHDTGKSGWCILIGIIPIIGIIYFLAFESFDSDKEDNEYGPSPKYVRKAATKNEQSDNITDANSLNTGVYNASGTAHAVEKESAQKQDLKEQSNDLQSESSEQKESVNEDEFDEPEFDEDEEALKKEIQFCLENDGTLTAAEYKYIESVASRLGIEKERVSEIVESCKPKLSADEQRYVDFYRDIVQDPKNVDSRTRRLLDREAFANGITHERQKELENIANI